MGDVWMASASQLSTWSRCKRKWYFEKVLKFFSPQHPSAELGERCHKALEDYVSTGEKGGDEDVLRILAPVWGQEWLLRLVRHPAVHVERKIEGLMLGGVGLNGRIDLEYRAASLDRNIPTASLSAEHIPLPDPQGTTHVIIDHKSTGNFVYAKDYNTAFGDPQTVVYGYAAFQNPEIQEVLFVYHYFRTKGVVVLPRCVIVRHTRETLAPLLVEFTGFLDEMRQMRELPLKAIPRNLDACWDFGGCHFRDACFATNEETLTEEQIMSNIGIDFDALLKNHAAQAPAPATTVKGTSFTPPVVPTPTTAAEVQSQVLPTAPPPAVDRPKAGLPLVDPAVVAVTAMIPGEKGRALFLCGCMIPGVPMVDIEELAAPYAERWSKANKGVHYLNSDFNKAERVLAVQLVSDMARGELPIPPIVYIRNDSAVGKFVRNELYLLRDRVVVVVPTIG